MLGTIRSVLVLVPLQAGRHGVYTKQSLPIGRPSAISLKHAHSPVTAIFTHRFNHLPNPPAAPTVN
jgi:hypothetical protein